MYRLFFLTVSAVAIGIYTVFVGINYLYVICMLIGLSEYSKHPIVEATIIETT